MTYLFKLSEVIVSPEIFHQIIDCFRIIQAVVVEHFTLPGQLGILEKIHIWKSLQWRHNERDGVSNQRRVDGLLNRLIRRRSKKTSKLRVTGLCEGNSQVAGEFPSQRANNAENGSIWWRHHDTEHIHIYIHIHMDTVLFGILLFCLYHEFVYIYEIGCTLSFMIVAVALAILPPPWWKYSSADWTIIGVDNVCRQCHSYLNQSHHNTLTMSPSDASMRQRTESALIQVMAWRRTGDKAKLLPEPSLTYHELKPQEIRQWHLRSFIEENASENGICKMSAILSRI